MFSGFLKVVLYIYSTVTVMHNTNRKIPSVYTPRTPFALETHHPYFHPEKLCFLWVVLLYTRRSVCVSNGSKYIHPLSLFTLNKYNIKIRKYIHRENKQVLFLKLRRKNWQNNTFAIFYTQFYCRIFWHVFFFFANPNLHREFFLVSVVQQKK